MNAKFPRYKKSKQEKQRKLKDDRELFNIALVIAMGVLADMFDFDENDLRDFMSDCNTLIDSLYENNDNLKAMQKVLADEYGIEVVEV